MPCIDDKVGDHLLQLRGICLHDDRWIEMRHQLDADRQRSAQPMERLLDGRAGCDWRAFRRVLLAELADLAHQVAGAAAGFADLTQALVHDRLIVETVAGQFRAPQNHREQVVEVVCDTTGERAQGIQALPLLQVLVLLAAALLVLRAPADVAEAQHAPDDDAVDRLRQRVALETAPVLEVQRIETHVIVRQVRCLEPGEEPLRVGELIEDVGEQPCVVAGFHHDGRHAPHRARTSGCIR